MGCKIENSEDIIKDEPKNQLLSFKNLTKGLRGKGATSTDSLEDRTYVCIGTHKLTRQIHFWVMTIDKDYEMITFWETTTNKKYELKGRIDNEEKENLKEFLTFKSKHL